MTKLPRIHVAIASYRDPECQHTVKDLFDKAEHPGRISVGVCWQVDPREDPHCFEVPPPYPHQVRVHHCLPAETRGLCWARGVAMALAKEEEYTLQIDSHMRFVPKWDTLILETLARCPTKNAILTAHAADYDPPDKLEDCSEGIWTIALHKFGDGKDDVQPLHLGKIKRKYKDIPKHPFATPFFVGNFLFGPTAVFRAIPYDPHMFFHGEESVYSARLWTHGYDIYQSDKVILYHYWNVTKTRGRDSKGNYKQANPRALVAYERMMHLLRVRLANDPAALVEIEKYGMGNVRSLEDFWAFSGVDMVKRTFTQEAGRGLWWQMEKPKKMGFSASLKFLHSLDMKHGTTFKPLTRKEK